MNEEVGRLLPYILETLTRKPRLSSTFDSLSREIEMQLCNDQIIVTGDLRAAMRRTLVKAQDLGLISLTNAIEPEVVQTQEKPKPKSALCIDSISGVPFILVEDQCKKPKEKFTVPARSGSSRNAPPIRKRNPPKLVTTSRRAAMDCHSGKSCPRGSAKYGIEPYHLPVFTGTAPEPKRPARRNVVYVSVAASENDLQSSSSDRTLTPSSCSHSKSSLPQLRQASSPSKGISERPRIEKKTSAKPRFQR